MVPPYTCSACTMPRRQVAAAVEVLVAVEEAEEAERRQEVAVGGRLSVGSWACQSTGREVAGGG